MRNGINTSRGRIYVLSALFWVLLWILPWSFWLASLPWIRLGIALILFTAPGVIVSLLLSGKELNLANHFVSGFAFSVFFIGAFGLVGRIVHLPFEFIKPAFAATGLIVLLILVLRSGLEEQVYKPQDHSVVILVFLLLVISFSIVINRFNSFHGDDLTYLAYLTSWQHAQALDFQEVYFGSGNLDSIRFWLGMFPISLAFLAEISNLRGILLIGFYLEPFLIMVAILSIYNLYNHFLPTERAVLISLLLQFTFLFLLRGNQQPGHAFFNRLSEDKVIAAFVLFPVLFLSTSLFIKRSSLPSALCVILSGLGLAMTHPVILAFSIFIVGVYAGIVTILGKEYKKAAMVCSLLASIILPTAGLRFIEVSSASSIPYNLEAALELGAGIESRISYLAGTPFYGFNPERIQILAGSNNHQNLLQAFLSWSYLWILVLGLLWSIFHIKRNALAPFIAASCLLILLALIPYTGWMIGFFVSARMLWRVPWLIPIGLIGAVLVSEFLRWIIGKISLNQLSKASTERVVHSLIIGICLISIVFFSVFVYGTEWKVLARIDTHKDILEELAALGNYLEANIEKPSIFIAAAQPSRLLPDPSTQSMMDYLPGLSSKSKIVFFRGYYAPYLVDMDKLRLIFSPAMNITLRQRINILRKNHIQYVLMDDRALIEIYANKPEFFEIRNFNDYWILELRDIAP